MTNREMKHDTEAMPAVAPFSWLESAKDFDWTLLLASTILYIDCALVWSGKPNLLSVDWSGIVWTQHIAWAILAALGFCALVSGMLPAVERILKAVVIDLRPLVPLNFGRDRTYSQAGPNEVSPWKLKEHADRTQSDYVLALYKEWKRKVDKRNHSLTESGRLALRTLVLLTFNLYLVSPQTPTMLAHIAGKLSTEAFVAMLIAAIGVLIRLVFRSWCRDLFPNQWIDYAPLYDLLRSEQKEKQRRYG